MTRWGALSFQERDRVTWIAGCVDEVKAQDLHVGDYLVDRGHIDELFRRVPGEYFVRWLISFDEEGPYYRTAVYQPDDLVQIEPVRYGTIDSINDDSAKVLVDAGFERGYNTAQQDKPATGLRSISLEDLRHADPDYDPIYFIWADEEYSDHHVYAPCYQCMPVTGRVRRVTGEGPTVNTALDPTATVHLECGHLAI